MKLRTIALNTLGGFMRDRLLIVFAILFICVVLLMMTPLLATKAMYASNLQQGQSIVLQMVSVIMFFVSGCGSLLAAWAAADAVASELKSGTVLAVMARPVKRWEFLLGKYFGVLLLMIVYVVMMFALSYLLAWIGGQRIHSALWVLLVYPLVRYSIYAALAMALVTILHPVITWAIALLIGVLSSLVTSWGEVTNPLLRAIKALLFVILPSTGLLSEERFLTIRDASLQPMRWFDHLTALSYGVDYALVLLLLAMWSFHYRSLKRD